MHESTEQRFERIAAVMPALASMPDELRRAVGQEVQFVVHPDGSMLFQENQACEGFPVVLRGCVRVARRLDSGREFLMYEIEPGESCVMSTGALLGSASFGAHGQCMTEVEIAVLPRPLFERLVAEHKPFRDEVFFLFNERLMRLMELVEAVGFQRLDQRLAAALLGKGQRFQTSHEQLARVLGVSRESVSRQLKHFEDEGWVKLGRGAIEILAARALREVAAHGSDRSAPVNAVTDPPPAHA